LHLLKPPFYFVNYITIKSINKVKSKIFYKFVKYVKVKIYYIHFLWRVFLKSNQLIYSGHIYFKTKKARKRQIICFNLMRQLVCQTVFFGL